MKVKLQFECTDILLLLACVFDYCHMLVTMHLLLGVLEGNQNEPICACMNLGGCCLQTMTMKKIRHQLNAIFGVDLLDRKDFLGLQVCSTTPYVTQCI